MRLNCFKHHKCAESESSLSTKINDVKDSPLAIAAEPHVTRMNVSFRKNVKLQIHTLFVWNIPFHLHI